MRCFRSTISVEKLLSALSTSKQVNRQTPIWVTLHYYKSSYYILLSSYLVYALIALSSFSHLFRDSSEILGIPKEGKNSASCASYYSISLLNIDLKLFTKIIASRLSTHMSSFINSDQVGFIPSSKARDNTIKALHLVHSTASPRTPCRKVEIECHGPLCFPLYNTSA